MVKIARRMIKIKKIKGDFINKTFYMKILHYGGVWGVLGVLGCMVHGVVAWCGVWVGCGLQRVSIRNAYCLYTFCNGF